jgi:hypothetical protein
MEGEFSRTVKELLDQNERTSGKANKAKIVTKIFDYIVENKTILDKPEWSRFNETMYNKLIELKSTSSDVFDSDKYIKLLFPNGSPQDNNTQKQNQEEKVEKGPEPKPESEPETQYDKINVKQLTEIFEKASANGGDCVTESKTFTKFVFDDYNQNMLSDKCVYYNVNFVNAVMNHLSSKRESCNKDLILAMLNDNKTVEQIKNDTTYENGPFIIKLSDHMYELYEKETKVVVNAGYFYNSTTTNVTINKVGKYALL